MSEVCTLRQYKTLWFSHEHTHTHTDTHTDTHTHTHTHTHTVILKLPYTMEKSSLR